MNHFLKNQDTSKPQVMAILTKRWGSAPQTPGAKMLIWKGGFWGTLGGGQLEFEVLKRAELLLESSDKTHVEEYKLSTDLKQCCGGKVEVYFEKQMPLTKVLCFGAGHVAQQLASVLVGTTIELHIVDERSEWINQLPLGSQGHLIEPLKFLNHNLSDISTKANIAVVMTHSHDLDEKLIDTLASKSDFKHIGLIGSDTKWRRFKHRLGNASLTESMLEKVQCPVGVFKGKSKEPRDIAISIAAQILQWVDEGES
ncbi:MAG: xanthine dehydrogenase accessory protein XdhC [Oligoflexia bacterium]|nr:xanthine dehydrogenase accessory protein XdhC [Oligoflexia bacterium]